MKGHCILSHGLESGPQATKVSALAAAAGSVGWSSERPDYRDLDATRDVKEVHSRLQRLLTLARVTQGPLVLAGSSMGAFISARATLELQCVGLFLIAPPVSLPGFPLSLDAAALPTWTVHGWDDELIPASQVVDWSKARRDRLLLVNDSHRLEHHVDTCARLFAQFLQSIE